MRWDLRDPPVLDRRTRRTKQYLVERESLLTRLREAGAGRARLLLLGQLAALDRRFLWAQARRAQFAGRV